MRSAEVHVDRSSVVNNEAIGGDGNVSIPLLPFDLPAAHRPGGGVGGGIAVYQGEADISRTEIIGNLAEGRPRWIGSRWWRLLLWLCRHG